MRDLNCDKTNNPLVIPNQHSLAGWVSYYCTLTPEKTAIVFNDKVISYQDLEQNIDRYARAMIVSGLKKGDRVAVLSTPRPEFLISYLAAIKIGLIWVGLNPSYTLNELDHIIEDSQPKVLFSIAKFKDSNYSKIIKRLLEHYSLIDKVIAIDGNIANVINLSEFLKLQSEISTQQYLSIVESTEPKEGSLLVYTSGTTGKPKGVLLSTYGITSGAIMQASHFDVVNPKVVVNFPINHVACIADTCATTLTKGGTIIFQEHFDPCATLKAIQDEKCNLMMGVPTMFQMMLGLPNFNEYDLSSIQCIVWGGAAMPIDAISQLQKISARLISVYGLTESSADMVFCSNRSGIDALAKSIGRPDKSVKCRINDVSGNACPAGIDGELQFKSDFFFLKYWNQAEATKQAFTTDGWLKTGDIGFMRDDGNIELVGRISEMFKSGGYNIYPREIELVLESIKGVYMAAVVSVDDAIFQEVGHAFVVLENDQTITLEELRQGCKSKLANYKVPKIFELRSHLPLLPIGKIDKTVLKREMSTQTN